MKKNVLFYFFLVFILQLSCDVCISQTYKGLLYKGTSCTSLPGGCSDLQEYTLGQYKGLAYGFSINDQIDGKIHFKQPNIYSMPLLTLESEIHIPQTDVVGKVKFLFQESSNIYGIFQNGLPSGGLNYFENRLQLGNPSLSGSELLNVSGTASISDGLYLGRKDSHGMYAGPTTINASWILDFKLVPDPSVKTDEVRSYDPVFRLYNYGPKIARVYGTLITEGFQMAEGCGENKVFVSDASGKARWVTPVFDDGDWLRTRDNDLSSVCRFVGIGTELPEDKFQVNEGAFKFVVGKAYSADLNNASSYIGFNTARNNGTWTGNPTNYENGGATIYSNIYGDISLVPIISTHVNENRILSDLEIKNIPRLTVINNGSVTIGTPKGDGGGFFDLAVFEKNTTDNSSRIVAMNPTNSELWAVTTNASIGLKIDENNHGHICSNPWGNYNYVNFYNGKVAIGTDDFSKMPSTNTHNLFVMGGITTEEVTVLLQPQWVPDFVFEDNYRLPSLKETEDYIALNKHLPGVPSAEEISDKGMDLGKMNLILLQKIEELTLTIIKLEKRINQLEDRNK